MWWYSPGMSSKVAARLRVARMVVVATSILLGVIAACDKSNSSSAGGGGGHGGRGAEGGAGGVGASGGAGGAGGHAFCADGTIVYAQPGCGLDAMPGCATGAAGACGAVYCGCDGVLRVENCAYGTHPYAYRGQVLDPQHPDCDPNAPPPGAGGGAGDRGAQGGAAGAINE